MLNNKVRVDILDCISSLSNDEVFTPPKLTRTILDLLPEAIWSNKELKFLDPVSKSGVFLREITKKLMKGLKNEFPDKKTRLNHILKNQVYGIATTELTAYISRRTLYTTKFANGPKSVCDEFENDDGNIYFKDIEHDWNDGNCNFCNANIKSYNREDDLENYAYNFIHTKNPKELLEIEFDVIVGNPPYHLSDGGAGASAQPIFQKFVEQALKLNPRYLTMIVPSRWFTGGKGLKNFRERMLNDGRIRELHDYIDAKDCFPGVEIKGGVNYFLWERDNPGKCKISTYKKNEVVSVSERELLEEKADVFIRHNEMVNIFKKVIEKEEDSFMDIVKSRPFGLRGSFKDYQEKKYNQSVKLYLNQKIGYIDRNVLTRNEDLVDKIKIYVPKAWGIGNIEKDKIKPFIGEKNSACTETYLCIGPFDNMKNAINALNYMKTKFFHVMIFIKKISQDTWVNGYYYVPMQDFGEEWTDKKLYKKYNFSDADIEYLENTIIRESE